MYDLCLVNVDIEITMHLVIREAMDVFDGVHMKILAL